MESRTEAVGTGWKGKKKNRHMSGGKSMLAWIDCVLHFSQTDKLYLSTFAAEVSMLNFNKASTTSS
ncbi:hypothetical protein [Klebsiella pneumoniae]|uniref:hypothetical protein n=1 Tax=Klebsiella pneumoniae TaxID=573 RepID=UPI001B395B3D|nr:hypothetical protein [Klebsiella pneumoniae]MBQ0173184.1 hypothetical protein [Klebsiella pneumoniae]